MFSLKTPDFSHISKKYKDSVYEPSEDTFLLIDGLEKDFESIKKARPLTVLEVGSGSGVVITALASALKNTVFCISTDINANASRATRESAVVNKTQIEAIRTDLVTGLLPRLTGSIDILIFNPPYVVTPGTEMGKKDLSAAWAGGRNGREVMDRFFPLVDQLLSPNGIFYLVIIKENSQDDIERIMTSFGFASEVVVSRKSGQEHLSILKFLRCNNVKLGS